MGSSDSSSHDMMPNLQLQDSNGVHYTHSPIASISRWRNEWKAEHVNVSEEKHLNQFFMTDTVTFFFLWLLSRVFVTKTVWK